MGKWGPRTFRLLIGLFGVLLTIVWGAASFVGSAPRWPVTGLILLGFVFGGGLIALLFAQYGAGADDARGERYAVIAQVFVMPALIACAVVLTLKMGVTLFDAFLAGSADNGASLARTCQTQLPVGGNVLSARFRRTGTNTIVVPYMRSATVVGKLTDGSGEPLGNRTLCVEERLLGSGSNALSPHLRATRTDPQGSYAYRISSGPNREVVFNYQDDMSQTTYGMRYYANSMPTLRRSPGRVWNNGAPVHFWGTLSGPHARGRVVVLQAQEGPMNWITFRQATTDRAGRFRASYRFRNTFDPTTYSFRVLAPRQTGYPWLPGTSRPVSVRVN